MFLTNRFFGNFNNNEIESTKKEKEIETCTLYHKKVIFTTITGEKYTYSNMAYYDPSVGSNGHRRVEEKYLENHNDNGFYLTDDNFYLGENVIFSIEFEIDGIIENVKKLKIKMYGCDDISWLFYSNNEIEIIRKE